LRDKILSFIIPDRVTNLLKRGNFMFRKKMTIKEYGEKVEKFIEETCALHKIYKQLDDELRADECCREILQLMESHETIVVNKEQADKVEQDIKNGLLQLEEQYGMARIEGILARNRQLKELKDKIEERLQILNKVRGCTDDAEPSVNATGNHDPQFNGPADEDAYDTTITIHGVVAPSGGCCIMM
jgi:hypothetical protein